MASGYLEVIALFLFRSSDRRHEDRLAKISQSNLTSMNVACVYRAKASLPFPTGLLKSTCACDVARNSITIWKAPANRSSELGTAVKTKELDKKHAM